jgi:DNA replication and repair protein RecF
MADGEVLGYDYMDRCGIKDYTTIDADSAAVAIQAELKNRAHEEHLRNVTLVGPHKDDILLTIQGRDARSFGSQGQQRTIALAWKLAEVELVEEVLRRKPVLLLDDVMSELDAKRRAALSEVVTSEIQTIVTTTNTGYFTPKTLKNAKVVEIEKGPA